MYIVLTQFQLKEYSGFEEEVDNMKLLIFQTLNFNPP